MNKPVNCIYCKYWDSGCTLDISPCRSFSKFKPKEKQMENKIIFESEDYARNKEGKQCPKK